MSFPDLGIAVRHLPKSPGSTAPAVVMPATGIDATTVAFSMVEAVLLSVVAFSATQRLQEMAFRMALRSQRSGIPGLIFLSADKLALAGCALGLIATAWASDLLNSLLFAVSPFDPVVLSLAAAS